MSIIKLRTKGNFLSSQENETAFFCPQNKGVIQKQSVFRPTQEKKSAFFSMPDGCISEIAKIVTNIACATKKCMLRQKMFVHFHFNFLIPIFSFLAMEVSSLCIEVASKLTPKNFSIHSQKWKVSFL